MENTKKIKILGALFLIVMMLAACSKGGQTGGTSTTPEATATPLYTVAPEATNTPVPTATNTPTPTNTSTPTPSPVIYLNQMDIKGVEINSLTQNGLMHFMSIGYEAEYEGKSIGEIDMACDGKGNIAFLYSVSDISADGETVYEDNRDFYVLFTKLEYSSLKVIKRVYLGKAQFCWITERENAFIVNKSVMDEDEVSHQYVQFFNFSGEEISNSSLKEESISGAVYLSGNMQYYYESDYEAHTIRRVNLVTGEKNNIDYDEKLCLKSFYGVSTINGVDYLCASFLGGDLQEYEGIINADTGKTFYLRNEDEIGYIASADGYFIINSKYSEGAGITSTVFNGVDLISYKQSDDFGYTYYFLGDKLAMVYTTYETRTESYVFEDGEVYEYTVTDKTITNIALFDLATATIISSNKVELAEEKDLAKIQCLDENRLLLVFSDLVGAKEVFIWESDGNKYSDYGFEDAASIKVEKFTGFKVTEVGGRYVRNDFIPGECEDYLKEEREYADELEKKYDIKIHISNEVKGLMGGYVFEALNEKAVLRNCLETMDREFSKYPEGFFSLYKKLESYPCGLEIYFTGGLIGYEDGNLSQAGGLRTEDEDSINIALDGNDGRYEAAVHHEISHSIEVLIRNLCSEKLDEDIWNGINVKYGGDRTYYAMSYMYQDSDYLFGFKDNYKYTLEYWYLYGKKIDYSSVLFYDDYAMTYPTEDRSRIFERVMWDELDISKYPAVYEKFEYYCKLIRKMMTENGIDPSATCFWEKTLKSE